MSGVNFTIAQEGIELLREARGTTMVSLEAVIIARNDMAWGTVRIHLADAVIDIAVGLQDLPLNSDGDVEEFGVLTVSEAEPGSLSVEGVDKEAEWYNVGMPVTGITLVNDHVSAFEGGRETMERSFTQAIVFTLADGSHLVLDKGAWFSEMITIGKGAAWEDCVYDSSQDWENDPEEPEVRYVWKRTLEGL